MDPARKEIIKLVSALLLSLMAAVFLINIFFDLTEQVGNASVAYADDEFMAFILSLRSEKLTPLVVLITSLGNAWTYVVIIPVSAFILHKLDHRWLVSAEAAAILITASLLNSVLKNWISRPRPELDIRLITVSSFSYPSGHAMSAVAFYGFLIYLTYRFVPERILRWTLIVFLCLLIASIGLSRIYLGVHYPSDVLAGFIAGTIWLVICIFLIEISRYFRILGQKGL